MVDRAVLPAGIVELCRWSPTTTCRQSATPSPCDAAGAREGLRLKMQRVVSATVHDWIRGDAEARARSRASRATAGLPASALRERGITRTGSRPRRALVSSARANERDPSSVGHGPHHSRYAATDRRAAWRLSDARRAGGSGELRWRCCRRDRAAANEIYLRLAARAAARRQVLLWALEIALRPSMARSSGSVRRARRHSPARCPTASATTMAAHPPRRRRRRRRHALRRVRAARRRPRRRRRGTRRSYSRRARAITPRRRPRPRTASARGRARVGDPSMESYPNATPRRTCASRSSGAVDRPLAAVLIVNIATNTPMRTDAVITASWPPSSRIGWRGASGSGPPTAAAIRPVLPAVGDTSRSELQHLADRAHRPHVVAPAATTETTR